MALQPKKPASQILIHLAIRRFSNSQVVEEWDSANTLPINLAEKISEYLMRLGDANSLCLNIIIQLLTRGKVRVDFRDSTERLQLVNQKDIVSRLEALVVFDHWIEENKIKAEMPSTTQKIIIEAPRVKLPSARG